LYAPRVSRLRGLVTPNRRRPVLVYLHGGANINGGSHDTQLNGVYLADRFNVIVVVPNFRLGIFGYLGSELLRQRAGSGNSTGNYGQMDQRMALRWVRQNVVAFGGDADRVLLFGESTGAAAVANHLISDYHHSQTPDFQSAVLQSGAMQPWVAKTLPEAEAVFDAILKRVSCPARSSADSLPCLLNRSTLDVYRASYAQQPGDLPYGDSWNSCQWAPVVDGTSQPVFPRVSCLASRCVMVLPSRYGAV
jgi:para-nitrobenzyl esterase